LNQYLLDTNVCIYYIKGLYKLKSKFEDVGPENCFIFEITLAELKFGVAKSQAKKKNQQALENFLSGIQILPIYPSIDIYTSEKARL
jgi:tRNA(fMet)-specific endonuclease VapC